MTHALRMSRRLSRLRDFSMNTNPHGSKNEQKQTSLGSFFAMGKRQSDETEEGPNIVI